MGVFNDLTTNGSENLKLTFDDVDAKEVPLLNMLEDFGVSKDAPFFVNMSLEAAGVDIIGFVLNAVCVFDNEVRQLFEVVVPTEDVMAVVGDEVDENLISNLGTDCISGKAILGKFTEGGGASSSRSFEATETRAAAVTLFLILLVCFCCTCWCDLASIAPLDAMCCFALPGVFDTVVGNV